MTEPWELHDVFRSIVYAIAAINGHDREAALTKFTAGQTKLYGTPRTEWPLAGQCLWIDGDPKQTDWSFCRAPTKPGSPYCRKHHEICYREAEPWEFHHPRR